jgi:hypothetical protein
MNACIAAERALEVMRDTLADTTGARARASAIDHTTTNRRWQMDE